MTFSPKCCGEIFFVMKLFSRKLEMSRQRRIFVARTIGQFLAYKIDQGEIWFSELTKRKIELEQFWF